MNEYGFSSAVMAALTIFEDTSRASGRTTRLIERCQDDDIIVVSTIYVKKYHERLLRNANKKTRVICISISDSIFPEEHILTGLRGQRYGKVFYDHQWQLEYYKGKLKAIDKHFELLREDIELGSYNKFEKEEYRDINSRKLDRYI
jgi:hypothetical protein